MFEYFIGCRYLRAKQKLSFISLITFLSVAGVAVGVMALIVVIGVMSGFESDLKSRILGVESHLVINRQDEDFTDYRNALEFIKKMDDVESAAPFIYTQAMIRSSRNVSGSVIRGIDPDSAEKVIQNLDSSMLKKLSPDIEQDSSFPGIILGKELAANLGVFEDDKVYLVSPRGIVSPAGHMPAMKKFRVAGIFESGMYEYDGTLAYISLDEAQKILRMGDHVTGIDIRLKYIDDAEKIGKKIVAYLGESYAAKNWMQMNQSFFSALKLEKTAMFIILTLIVLVAAFNIASSLIMMVMEKTKDIAILKAMGASDKSIRRIFVFKGMVIGCTGTAIGVSMGSLLCFLLKKYEFVKLPADVYYITTLPVNLGFPEVIIIAAAAIAICFIATLYPAHQASSLNPVEAFRYG